MALEQKPCHSDIIQKFKMFDTNRDGKIDSKELTAVIQHLRQSNSGCYPSMDEVNIKQVLAAFDTNGDGYIDYEEWVEWLTSSRTGPAHGEALVTKHVFVTPLDEARMERETLFELRRTDNARILQDLGHGGLLDDGGLLVLSVGSSSTQAYDLGPSPLLASFPMGTRVRSEAAMDRFHRTMKESKRLYRFVLLVNSIGYALKAADPCLLDLATLVATQEDDPSSTICGVHSCLKELLPLATVVVFNRAKDAATKRYRYPQLVNDFSESLARGRGLGTSGEEEPYEAIVDWGGSSYKIYVQGRRVATEVMDANGLLCAGGAVVEARLKEQLDVIVDRVREAAPAARRLLIAQTGKARELALSCS